MKLLEALLDLVYPPRCVFCHRLLPGSGISVCRTCREQLPYTGTLAERSKIKSIEHCFSPLFYEKTVRDSLHRYKFEQRRGYAGVYADFMLKCIDENQISCDSITWVPVSRRRLHERGYDQSELLARAIAAKRGVPCLRLLEKSRHTRQQSLIKDPGQRKANVKGAYRCVDPSLAAGRRFLLVDDIVTSGATLSECAKVLKEAGAAGIIALTVARKRD